MTLATVTSAAYPTHAEIRSQILSDIYYWGLTRSGIELNVAEGSDHFYRADANARLVTIAIANGKLGLADYSPLTATGDALVTLAAIYGVFPRPDAGSAGSGIVGVVGGGTVTIPDGHQCQAPNGELYAVSGAVLVADGDDVSLSAVGTGTVTNQPAGTVLRWTSGSVAFLKTQVTVGETADPFTGDIDGGVDEDSEEKLRERLLRRLAFPAAGGNWAEVVQWAEEATASVGTAFVYPAVRGPGSYDVAVLSDSGDRSLSDEIVQTVESYILSKMPGHADLNTTSADAAETDVVLAATLPLPTASGGAGGGWQDSAPWPVEGGGLTPLLSGTPTLTFAVGPPGTITRSTGSWFNDRFVRGVLFDVENTTLNDGQYVAASMTDTVLTVDEDYELAAEVVVAISAGSVSSLVDVPVRVRSKSGTNVTVTSDATPVLGQHFGIWDPDAEEMNEFTVQSVFGSTGAWVVNVGADSDALSFIPDGDYDGGWYISTGAVNLASYASDFHASMASLGPGEKTTSPDILPRGRRHPGPDIASPANLTTVQLASVTRAHEEVLDLNYSLRAETGTVTRQVSPPVPANTASPPNVLRLHHLAIVKAS